MPAGILQGDAAPGREIEDSPLTVPGLESAAEATTDPAVPESLPRSLPKEQVGSS